MTTYYLFHSPNEYTFVFERRNTFDVFIYFYSILWRSEEWDNDAFEDWLDGRQILCDSLSVMTSRILGAPLVFKSTNYEDVIAHAAMLVI